MKPFSLEEYLANPSRKVVTKDGKSVRIICTDAKGICPVVGLVAYENYELAFNVMKDGKIDGILDLFFAPEKKEGWINIFKGASDNRFLGYTCIFKTKENAEEGRKGVSGYITTIKIEWEE